MKFKDKDGNVYKSITAAHNSFCRGKLCTDCRLSHLGGLAACVEFTQSNPAEAARLMGYEVIEDGEDINAPTKQEPMTRETILEAARNLVCGDREQDYGSPENNFQTIANLWIDYLQGKGYPVDIEPQDVACMLALLKIARIATGHAKADNWIDLAGYAACGGEIEGKEE